MNYEAVCKRLDNPLTYNVIGIFFIPITFIQNKFPGQKTFFFFVG